MNWKAELEQLEHDKNWKAAIGLMDEVVDKHPDDVEAYVRAIYLLLNILLEEDYPYKHDIMANLLKKYFDDSYSKFSEVPECLVPYSRGVIYKLLKEVDLWHVYTMLSQHNS